MSLRRHVARFVPPILADLIKGDSERRFPSWADACANAEGYEADLVNRFRVARHELRVRDGSLLRASALGLLALRYAGQPISVTDFGGATGELGLEFLDAFPGCSYTVVENATLVEMMRGKTSVQFTTDIPHECDIFLTSGTLQYIDSPLSILGRGLQTAKRAAILARNSFSDTETFHVQNSHLFDNGNGPIPPTFHDRKISYPHRTIREPDVLRVAEESGFSCYSMLEEFSGARWESYGKQLVFIRSAG